MLLPYWDYYVEKNWNYTLYPEIIHSNVFCYGKPNSGRTKKVAIPIAKATIDEGRSCIIYAEHASKKYKTIRDWAIQCGYRLFELEATELDAATECCCAEEIVKNIQEKKPTLALISDRNFNAPLHRTIMDSLLNKLYKSREREPNISIKPHAESAQIVLDNLCGNMALDLDILAAPNLLFCITMGSQVAYLPWLEKTTSEVLAKKLETTMKASDLFTDLLTPVVVQRFFYRFDTVICTGVNGVKPEMHREFVGGYMFDIPTIRIGGRFVIMENRPETDVQNVKSIFPNSGKKMAIDEDTIETSSYGELAADYICRGRWILEQNGKPYLYFDGTTYRPAVFSEKQGALDWLSVKIQNEKMKLLRFEQKEGMVQCECFKNNAQIEFFLTFITKADEEAYQIAYLLRVLEMAELEDLTKWLQTDEAFSQGYDPKDGLDINIKKYYTALDENAAKKAQNLSLHTEETSSPSALLPIEPYWEKYQGAKAPSQPDSYECADVVALPQEGVLFLGGHRNMVKKIQPLYPGWIYITDDQFRSTSAINVKYVFYWTNHSSHKMMENVFSKLAPDADIIYVTATNIDRLENEMLTKFIENKSRKRRGAPLDAQQ